MKVVVAFFFLLVLGVGAWFMMSTKPSQADFIVIAGNDVDTLDPQAASWLVDFRVIGCMFEPLLSVDTKTMQLEAGAADKWEVSEDKLTYTFHIRENAKWSNGDSLTAHDYIYAWSRAIIPDYNSSYFSLHMHIKGAKAVADRRRADLAAYADEVAAYTKAQKDFADKKIETAPKPPMTPKELWAKTRKDFADNVGLKAKDDKTLVVTLERPVTYYLHIIAFDTYVPVHKKSVEATETFESDGRLVSKAGYFSDPASVITNGAYVLKERNFKEYTLLTANPHYWDRVNMGNESIMFRVIESENTQLLEYQAGNAHWLPDIPTASSLAADLVQQQREGKRKDVHVEGGAGTYFYHFNCLPLVRGEKNPMADPRVRRAMSMAIDRKTIVEKVTRLNQPIAKTMTPLGLGMAGYEPPVEAGVDFDPVAARALLAEAGYPEGKGFPQNLKIMYNTAAGHEIVAQPIQQDWEKHLGIKVALEGVEKNRAMEMRRNQDFGIARGGWYGDYPDPTTFLEQHITKDGQNHSGYSNPKFDELYYAAGKEIDPVKRNALLREAETIMLMDQPIAPIYQYIHLNLYDKEKVENLNTNPWNYRALHEVKVKK